MKTFLRSILAAALLTGTAFAATPNLSNAKSPIRYRVISYPFSTTASLAGVAIAQLQPGMVLKDVVLVQNAAGVGGTNWTATPKKTAIAMVSTAGGWTLAAGASKVTNAAGSPIQTLGAGTGATRPVIKGNVAATQTVTVGTPAAGDTLVIGGVTFTARASGAVAPAEFNIGGSATITGDNIVAMLAAHPFVSVKATNATGTLTLTAKRSGTVGNAITLTKTGSALTLGNTTLLGGYDAASTAGEILTLDVTLTGTYSTAVSGVVELYFEPAL